LTSRAVELGPDHELTQRFGHILDDNGLIEERTTEQMYSIEDGRFLPTVTSSGPARTAATRGPAAISAKTAGTCWTRPS